MELNKVYKVKNIKLSNKLLNKIENVQKNKPKTNLKSYINKKEESVTKPLVKIETGSFIIQL